MDCSKNIVFTGFMGTGKSTVARLVALKLGWNMVDIDQEIEAGSGMKISDIFERFGEAEFRRMEAEYIAGVSKLCRTVVATGGGAVLRKENMKNLRKNGIIILLKASPEIILRNTCNDIDRPLLRQGNALERIHELLSAREQYYQDCDYEIEVSSLCPEQVKEKVLDIVRNRSTDEISR